MTLQNSKVNRKEESTIQVDYEELIFFKKHGGKGFASNVAELLDSDGVKISRVVVHKELTTLKNGYNPIVIEKARHYLKAVKGLEYTPVCID